MNEKPAKPMPYVIVEVENGIAITTLTIAGQGSPVVYIWDHVDINKGCTPPEIPKWILDEYELRHSRRLEINDASS